MKQTRNLLGWMRKWLPQTHESSPGSSEEVADPDLSVAVSESEDRVRVEVGGELDLVSAEALEAKLLELEAKAPPLIELDLRRLKFLDSSGLALLFAANRRAVQTRRRLVLLRGPGPIERVLTLARVEDVIDTVEEPAARD